MLRFLHLQLLAVLSLPVLLTPLAIGQRSDAGTSLFNGTDLTGWRYSKAEVLHLQTETSDKRFYVAGGALVAAAKDKDGNKGQKDLMLVREFNKDFVIRLEFKASQEATGAILIRNHAVPVNDFVRRGEFKFKNFKNDGWNELEVTVKMCAYALGRRLTDSETLQVEWKAGKATATLNGMPIDANRTATGIDGFAKINGEWHAPFHNHWGFHVQTRGYVGIRTGSQKMEYRNIRFHELQ